MCSIMSKLQFISQNVSFLFFSHSVFVMYALRTRTHAKPLTKPTTVTTQAKIRLQLKHPKKNKNSISFHILYNSFSSPLTRSLDLALFFSPHFWMLYHIHMRMCMCVPYALYLYRISQKSAFSICAVSVLLYICLVV